jgi:outer membrane receptor protein involved in Fe transport
LGEGVQISTYRLIVAAFATLPVIVAAAQDRHIEEIIVTAQRIEENARKVPISVSAFTDAMIDDRQIIGITDLQINVPNLSLVPENFGGAQVAVRGIGGLYVGDSRETSPSVPIHINGISAPVDVSVLEFYDLERIEVLRGPQGTLYGRSATAGAINLVTRRPDFDGFGGYVDLEYGDYDHVRVKGAVNVAINDQLAFRAAGMSLERDGYIDNKAAGELPGIDDNLDGRDFHAYRLTAEWRPTEVISAWLIYSRFEEDDSKVRIQNQVCKPASLPSLGCDPDEFGLDPLPALATGGGLVAAGAGAIPPGANDVATGLTYEFPRPPLGLREQYTDFNPVFDFEEEGWLFGIDWAFEPVTISLTGSYFDASRLSQQDYSMDVGYILNPTSQNPSGLWPTSAPSGGPGALRGGGPCDLESARAGVMGGCVLNTDLNRYFAYDQAGADTEFWSAELRARSSLDGPVNFLLGTNYIETDSENGYYVIANALDLAGFYGAPGIGFPQLYPTLFHSATEMQIESYSAFGELYVDLTERLKLTGGLRYNYDEIDGSFSQVLFNSVNLTPFFGGALGTDPQWVRNEMTSYLGGTPSPSAIELADYYDASNAIQTAAGPVELVGALQLVPIAPRLGEAQDLRGLPRNADWDDVSGRIGLDWAVTDDALIYGFLTQGYRPGGLNASLGVEPSFDSEHVNTYELGAKTLLASGSLGLNGAVFFSDYDDLQVLQQLGSGAVTTNVDAETVGLELEAVWRPIRLPSLALEFSYAWLHSELKNRKFWIIRIAPRGTQTSSPSETVTRDWVMATLCLWIRYFPWRVRQLPPGLRYRYGAATTMGFPCISAAGFWRPTAWRRLTVIRPVSMATTCPTHRHIRYASAQPTPGHLHPAH